MRLFKALIVLVAVLDAAMFLQSVHSPLSATNPTQAMSYAAADVSAPEPIALGVAGNRP